MIEMIEKCGHDHPQLLRPVGAHQLVTMLSALATRAPSVGCPGLVLAASVDEAHLQSERRYAECDPRKRIIYASRWILYLPASHRLGLLAHELGHIYLGQTHHSEDAADAAALDEYGIEITHDHRWPGKGLQRGRDMWRKR